MSSKPQTEDESERRRFTRYTTDWEVAGGKILDVSEKGFAFTTHGPTLQVGDILGISINIYEPYLFGRIMRIIKPGMYGVELEPQLTQRLQAKSSEVLLLSYMEQVQRIVDLAMTRSAMSDVSLVLLGQINWVQPSFLMDEKEIVQELVDWFHDEMKRQKSRNNPLEQLMSHSVVRNDQGAEERAVLAFKKQLLRTIFRCDSVNIRSGQIGQKEDLVKQIPWIASLYFQEEIVPKALRISETAQDLLNKRTDLFRSVVSEFDMEVILRTEEDGSDIGAVELF